MALLNLLEKYPAWNGKGLPSFCTANEYVLKAILDYAAYHQFPVLIESTCNQVNQEGGYTGMKPVEFTSWLSNLAESAGVTNDHLVLGGDHLGPNPWSNKPADIAMNNAEMLVRDYVEAGFRKIHIDASMACGGESTPSFELVASRAARLCRIAKTYAPNPDNLIYVIGTEVSVPGGETDDMDELSVTTTDRLKQTIDTHRDAFANEGLTDIWSRIVSIVTQPGVDFSHTSVHRFQPDQACELSAAILKEPGMTFEVHSTDYQPTQALEELVDKHFYFLKVGPELTFRMREAVFALANIEKIISPDCVSDLITVLDQSMDENPSNWKSHYQGSTSEVNHLRHYSFSDRIRYYWAMPTVGKAVERMITNLESVGIPETMVSQYFPNRAFGDLNAAPRALISDHIKLCVARYYRACGY